MKQVIQTDDAPAAIGPYSQAIKVGNSVYCSGQVGLDPKTMQLVAGGLKAEAEQMFRNLAAVVKAAGGDFSSIVKLTIYLTDMNDFQTVNQIMEQHCQPPYPARACVAVKALPKNACVEIEAIMVL